MLYVIIFLLNIFPGCSSCNTVGENRKSAVSLTIQENARNQFYSITKIVDGDTFWIDDGSATGLKIRLIGIDAPESQNRFRKKTGFLGKESTQFLTALTGRQKVRLELDVRPVDQFKRTLAYAFLEDGRFINAEMVKQGYALVMTVPPNVKYADSFLVLQQEARENGRGLWADTTGHDAGYVPGKE